MADEIQRGIKTLRASPFNLRCLLLLMMFLAMPLSMAHADGILHETVQGVQMTGKLVVMSPIRFYGKVLDQYDQPVAGAEVEMHINKFSLNPKALFGRTETVRRKTDARGGFGISNERGFNLFVGPIKQEGYEYTNDQNPSRGFDYSGEVNVHVPDKAKPVIFRMRKMGMTTFLFQEPSWELGLTIASLGSTNGFDFIKRHRFDDANRLVFNGEPVFPDIKLKATFNTNDATWTIVLSPGNTNGGIIASEQLLYEAPETGYQPEYVFTPEDRPQQVKMPHLYLKSREQAIYTRIDIKYINANKDFFRLSGESVTNPYGERNLEMAPDLPGEIYVRLMNEAQSAFRANKRPSPPDLPKLVKEAKVKSGTK